MENKNILIIIGIAILAVIGYSTFSDSDNKEDGLGSTAFSSCETTTETSVSIGSSNSVTVLSATSGRSYARIQLARTVDGTSTSTPSIAFGATATLANGMQLSTTTPYLEFGMDTDHAYSGIVTAINSGSASTTLRVTECR